MVKSKCIGLQRSSVESGKHSGEGNGTGTGIAETAAFGSGEGTLLRSKHFCWLLTMRHINGKIK